MESQPVLIPAVPLRRPLCSTLHQHQRQRQYDFSRRAAFRARDSAFSTTMPMSGSLPRRLLATHFPKPKHAAMDITLQFLHTFAPAYLPYPSSLALMLADIVTNLPSTICSKGLRQGISLDPSGKALKCTSKEAVKQARKTITAAAYHRSLLSMCNALVNNNNKMSRWFASLSHMSTYPNPRRTCNNNCTPTVSTWKLCQFP
jgi:hypothetical protein